MAGAGAPVATGAAAGAAAAHQREASERTRTDAAAECGDVCAEADDRVGGAVVEAAAAAVGVEWGLV